MRILGNIRINDLVDGLQSEISIFADDNDRCKVMNTGEDGITLQRGRDRPEAWADAVRYGSM